MKKKTTEIPDDSFDILLEKRRRMFEAMGLDLPEFSCSRDREELFLQSVINCHYCKDAGLCGTWAKKNAAAKHPPGFCKNHDLILELLTRKRKPNRP